MRGGHLFTALVRNEQPRTVAVRTRNRRRSAGQRAGQRCRGPQPHTTNETHHARCPRERPRLRDDRRAADQGGLGRARRHHVPLLRHRVPREVREGPRRVPRRATGEAGRAGGSRGGLHLPDAPRDRAGRAGHLPDLRDGARAQGRRRRGRRRRATRLHPPLLDLRGAHRPDADLDGRGHAPRPAAARFGLGPGGTVDPAGPVPADRLLGGVALLRPRLDRAQDAPAEHVHADRDRRGRGLRLQRRRGDRPGPVPRELPRWAQPRRGGRGRRSRCRRRLLRVRRGDRHARAARPAAGAAGPGPHRRGGPRAAGPLAAHGVPRGRRAAARKKSRWRTSPSATASA